MPATKKTSPAQNQANIEAEHALILKRIQGQLAVLQARADRGFNSPKGHDLHWGHVGDLNTIAYYLESAVEFSRSN
jgi:hypothetical protein